ncbi:MAG: hypothetical protein KJO07_18960, partial [Deltaproteobacteria bacterium]|nr:hypothetical protein [Deltaproteobacteria bacterium]
MVGLAMMIASPADAVPWAGWERLEGDVSRDIDAAAKDRQSRYPKNIDIRWQVRQIGDFDFDAPVLAALAVQLDGEGPQELVVLTASELIALRGIGQGRPDVVQRLALKPKLGVAERWPRDHRGEIALVGTGAQAQLLVRSSASARGGKLAARLPLAIESSFSGFPACDGGSFTAVPGRG